MSNPQPGADLVAESPIRRTRAAHRTTARLVAGPGTALLSVDFVPAAAHAKKPRPCPRPNGAEHSSQAVLYVRSGDDDLRTLVGCHERTRRRTYLVSWHAQGSSADDPSPQPWSAGRFAALNIPSCTADPQNRTCTARFVIVDPRTGTKRATVDSLTDPIYDVVLLASGNAAFIHRQQLFAVINGQEAEVDSAADAGSLAYAPRLGRLYWMSSGQPKTIGLR